MKDAKTLAYINMYGILGCLEDLCRFSPEAKALACQSKLAGGKPGFEKPTAVSFVVRDGPAATLRFNNGACVFEPGAGSCDIKLPFSSCEKFNGMIDGTVTPFPSKGFTKIRFLTQNFTRMTKILESYLCAKPEDLSYPAGTTYPAGTAHPAGTAYPAIEPKAGVTNNDFFEASTTIVFHLISRAVSQIGNHDKIGRFSASNMVDGTVVLSIGGTIQAAITVKDHQLTTSRKIPAKYHAIMEFADLKLARDVFDGKVSTLGCVGNGLISMKGNLSMVDNINRILDRVAIYLA